MTVPFGFLPVAKPVGPSSAQVVSWLAQFFSVRRGHSGTLDPFAEGVLVVAIGKATRLLPFLDDETKEYHAAICLGVSTDTDDCEGVILSQAPEDAVLPREVVEKGLRKVAGRKLQRPPSYSAIKLSGRRAYELARMRRPVLLPTRVVGTAEVELIAYEWPMVWVRLVCGRGYYVRSFARDLGDALGVGAYLAWLYRTRSGRFTIEDCMTPLEISAAVSSGVSPEEMLVPPQEVMGHIPRVELDSAQVKAISHGKAIAVSELRIKKGRDASPIFMVSPSGELVAVARLEDGMLHPSVVLID